MDLDTLIVTVFCRIDDGLKTTFDGLKLRQRGRAPQLSDAEVLTIETVGEYLGLAQDKQLFEYFRRHHSGLFPALETFHSSGGEPVARQRTSMAGKIACHRRSLTRACR